MMVTSFAASTMVDRAAPVALLETRALSKTYGNGVRAVNGVDLVVQPGEVLGIVGESGCGKSSLVRLLLRIIQPDSGSVLFDGIDLSHLRGQELRSLRKRFQLVPQNPSTSLNPRLQVGESVAFNLRAHGWSRTDSRRRVAELFDMVGLAATHVSRYPHELSGGQIQRVAIARALATDPDLIVCDEAVSALDKSVQAQVLNLISSLQRDLSLAVVFISHDLAVVEHIADTVAVMYLGRFVELGPTDTVMTRPAHPYTQALLAAVPGTGRAALPLTGEPPSPVDPPSGCPFRTRCPFAVDACASFDNAPVEVSPGRTVRCLRTVREQSPLN